LAIVDNATVPSFASNLIERELFPDLKTTLSFAANVGTVKRNNFMIVEGVAI
jgi:hypothetical protein